MLATLKEVLEIANQRGTAIPHFNIDNIAGIEAVMEAADPRIIPSFSVSVRVPSTPETSGIWQMPFSGPPMTARCLSFCIWTMASAMSKLWCACEPALPP